MKDPSVPKIDAAAKPDETVTLADLAADIRAFLAAARAGVKAEEGGRAVWTDNTKKLGKALLSGRELHQNDNNAFNVWLNENELSDLVNKDERAALIRMAEYPEIAEQVLATTTSRSWQLIGIEIAGVLNAQNTPSKPKPNRGGRPRNPDATRVRKKTPAPSADPIDDVARELATKCADDKPCTIAQLAQKIQLASSAVEQALPRLGDAVKQNGIDAGTPTYVIERIGKPSVSSIDPIHDLACALSAKCSGPEWRTLEELASIVERKKDEVTEALKRLKADGLVEHQKSADGVALEYRISDDRAQFAPAGLQRKLEFANARVRELEQLLREKDELLREKDAQLREKDAKLRERDDEIAQLRAKPSSSVEQI
jgi:predicted transcriptional regulator